MLRVCGPCTGAVVYNITIKYQLFRRASDGEKKHVAYAIYQNRVRISIG